MNTLTVAEARAIVIERFTSGKGEPFTPGELLPPGNHISPMLTALGQLRREGLVAPVADPTGGTRKWRCVHEAATPLAPIDVEHLS